MAGNGSMEIWVRRANRSMYSLKVERSEIVRSLKEKIEKREGIPPDEQRLMIMGVRLEDTTTSLNDYGIRPNQTISLAWIKGGEMQIVIRDDQRPPAFLLEVAKSDRVETVKAKIAERLQITVERKKLAFRNVELEDRKIISDYPGIDLSVVHLVDR